MNPTFDNNVNNGTQQTNNKINVFAPKTVFSLKANHQAHFTPSQCTKIYNQQQNQSKIFCILDGPPYANGHIHLGTTINKIQKDIINQVQFMKGYNVVYIPGWDCHGLPIEKNVEKELALEAKSANFDIKKVPAQIIRSRCRDFANHWINVQAEEFAKLGVFASWDNKFKTMDCAISIMEKFHEFVEKGYVYKSLRPIMWSIAEQTSMATAEVEYKDHVSTAIYVKFKVKSSPFLPNTAHMVIWTTTPWTIPANRAIAYHEDIIYALVKIGQEELIVAQELIEHLKKAMNAQEHTIIQTFSGDKLEGTICEHPLNEYDFPVPLLFGEHVSKESGTGLVHTAPAHGEEDFIMGIKYGLEITDIVSDNGTFQNTPLFQGMNLKQAQNAILEKLGSAILSQSQFNHSYPYSWRSHTPLIYKVTPQWYIGLEQIKGSKQDNKEFNEQSYNIKNIVKQFAQEINWLPERSINRFNSMLNSRGDWCISRQRFWGTPLGLFTQNDQAITNPQVLKQTRQFLQEHGIDSWFQATPSQILGSLAADYPNAIKCLDTLDVWFDAGCMQFCLEQADRFQIPHVVDFYLEGSDQHRGFFQACLVINALSSLPVRNIITHGFILDAKGRKMSKSLGNVISPEQVINEYGVDMIRLWVALTDCTHDIIYSKQQMDKTRNVYERFRNTLRYLMSCLEDNLETEEIINKNQNIIQEPIHLALLAKFFSHEKYLNGDNSNITDNLQNFYGDLAKFCDEDLSKFYFDINKDCVYCDVNDKNEQTNNRAQILAVYQIILLNLTKWLTPVLKHTCQEVWEVLGKDSVFNQQFTPHAFEPEKAHFWEKCKAFRNAANAQIEPLREAGIVKQAKQTQLTTNWGMDSKLMEYIAMVGKVNIEKGDEIFIKAEPFKGTKCDRCRKYFENIDQLCGRCEWACN